MTEAVAFAAGNLFIFFESILHIFRDVRAIIRYQIFFVPVIKQVLLHRLLILIRIIAPYNDVAQIAGLHSCIIGSACFGNNVQFDIELVFNDLCKPADLLAGVISQLIVDIQRYRIFRNNIGKIIRFISVRRISCRPGCCTSRSCRGFL